jgi:hypothetical protein
MCLLFLIVILSQAIEKEGYFIDVSFLSADRFEDLTPPEMIRQNPKVDRTVSLYGFVRGMALNKTSSIHIPGKLMQQ